MLTPMNRAGGLPADVELRMADEDRLVAVTFHFRSHTGGVTAVPPDDVHCGKRESIPAAQPVWVRWN